MKRFELNKLTFAYPDVSSEREDAFLSPALSDVTLAIKDGAFVVVAGGSGSGKTTFLRQLKTTLTPRGRQTGDIFYRGMPLADTDARRQAQQIGYVAQDVDAQIVTDKVWHELAFGLESLGYESGYIRRRVAEMCTFFGLDAIFHKKVNELSGGQKQLVNLASVMALSPDVVLLDEPTSQLDPLAAQEFYGHLARINRELGTTVILSEHRLEEVLPMCSQFLLFEQGRLCYDGTLRAGLRTLYRESSAVTLPAAAEIAMGLAPSDEPPVTVSEGRIFLTDYDDAHEQVQATKRSNKADTEQKKKPILTLNDVWYRYAKTERDVLRGMDLTIYENEILAVNGSNGCGKSTFLSLLAGGCRPYRGRLRKEKELRIGLLPQDPKLLFSEATVREELGEFKGEAIGEDTKRVMEFCELTALYDRHPYDLSGGECQRLALARVLLSSPDVLLLDEPTKGMDAAFKRSFAKLLFELKKEGRTIVLVSHDIEFCAKVADRICLLFDGETATVSDTRKYVTENAYYTTAAARIAKGIVPDAVTVDDILDAYQAVRRQEPPDDGKEVPATDQANADEVYGRDFSVADAAVDTSNQRKRDGSIHEVSIGRKCALAVFTLILSVCFYLTVRQADLTQLVRGGAVTTDGMWYLVLYGGFILSLIVVICLLRPIGREKNQNIELRKRYLGNARTRWLMAGSILLAAATIWVGRTVLSDRKYYFISLLVLIEMLIPYITALEQRKMAARDIVTIAALCALATAGRTAFYMLPNASPVAALVIISGVAFGGEVGCIVGAVTMLASNMVFGQGPWTPWQMFAMGLTGGVAGCVFRGSGVKNRTVTRLGMSVFGGLSCILIYGVIMNPASVIMWEPQVDAQMLLASYVTGFPFDVVQGCATAVFLWILSRPFLEKLDRLKLKYGILL